MLKNKLTQCVLMLENDVRFVSAPFAAAAAAGNACVLA